MAFCPKCGKEVADGGQFCSACGAALNQTNAGPAPIVQMPGVQTGLQRNVAGLLCYLFGWISGIVFMVIEKDRWVRFHAMQSIIVFGAITALQILLSVIFSPLWQLWGFYLLLRWVVGMAEIGLWALLMYKAYNNEYYKLPVVGDMAERFSTSL